jgi:hypothetical protein
MRKGQFALEFVILVSFALFFTAMFLVVIQKSFTEARQEKNEEQINQIMRIIDTEIMLAESSPAGYTRKFYLPTNIDGKYYELFSTDGVDIVFKYEDTTYVFYLVNTSLGEDDCINLHQCRLQTGYNVIQKECPPSAKCRLNLLQQI